MKDKQDVGVISNKNDIRYQPRKSGVGVKEECKIEQKSIIVNDLLSFTNNNITVVPRSRLAKYLQDFYAESEALTAYHLLVDYLPIDAHMQYKKIRETNPYLAVLLALKHAKTYKNSQLLIVCKNLDNVPKMTAVKRYSVKKRIQFIKEHKAIKYQINELYKSLYQVREQFLELGLCDISTAMKLNDYVVNKKKNYIDCQNFQISKEHMKDITCLQQFVDEEKLEAGKKGIEIFEEKLQDFLIIEQLFDEHNGHFTLFKCSSCHFSSREENAVVNHICPQNKFADDEGADKKNRLHTCFSCMKTFKNSSSLRFHRESTHRYEKRKYQCPLCSDLFPEEIWKEHVRSCSGNVENTLSQDDIQCKVCDIFFSDEKLLKNHRAFHDQSRPFECYECKFRFYSQKTVEEHFKIHAIERLENSFKCPFCTRKFLLKIKLEEHVRTHTGERPYKCTLCNFSCTRPSGLKAHTRTHTERKDFECDICGRCFKVKTKLTVHRKVHSSHRPFKCPECGKGFKTGREMTTHHRNHLGIRNYPCPHCSYKAVNASVLRGHINVHFKMKPFKCSQCNFECNHRSYLNWHVKNCHPNIVITKLK